MFDFLFGDGQYGLRFLFAFIVVLGLIALTAWLVRRFGGDRLGAAGARGRQPRLAVIDAAAVDGRRRLILIRRDNVEHLLMIGGPTDVVVEANIMRAAAAPREAAPARTPAADTLPRAVPLGEGTLWPLQPHSEPAPAGAPVVAPRPQRPPVQEEPVAWPPEPELPVPFAPPPRQARQADPLAGLAAELSRQPAAPQIPASPRATRERPPARERESARDRDTGRERDLARERESAIERDAALEREAATREREAARERDAAAREREAALARDAARERMAARVPPPIPQPPISQSPMPQTPPASEPPFASDADQNLAEMAQRLEAAPRHPAKNLEAHSVDPEYAGTGWNSGSEQRPARTEARSRGAEICPHGASSRRAGAAAEISP
jgi:flagellar biogenesis protein FliO